MTSPDYKTARSEIYAALLAVDRTDASDTADDCMSVLAYWHTASTVFFISGATSWTLPRTALFMVRHRFASNSEAALVLHHHGYDGVKALRIEEEVPG